MPLVYIGVGSNMGEPEKNLTGALSELQKQLKSFRVSSFYKTEPRDYFDQEVFLNAVVSGISNLSPQELLEFTQSIEKKGGRLRNKAIPKGPRTIDLDILLYGREIINTDSLITPHPSIGDRNFVLIPLLELDNSMSDPQTGEYYYRELIKNGRQGVYCSSLNNYNEFFV
jgi:2-amino-4-hydroxy-6-hydroxymethyldihydropteridine diphosphokinase